MTFYVSEITQFIRTLKQEKPYLEAEQKKGRALLWDKTPLSLDESARDEASNVPQQPYVYANK
jgi:hypothetical protein